MRSAFKNTAPKLTRISVFWESPRQQLSDHISALCGQLVLLYKQVYQTVSLGQVNIALTEHVWGQDGAEDDGTHQQ